MADTKDPNELNIIIISDAAGDTAFSNATAAAAEFQRLKLIIVVTHLLLMKRNWMKFYKKLKNIQIL